MVGVSKTMKHETSSGIGVLGVLQIIFIVLKCVNVIDWPWRTVLIPLWIELALVVIAIIALIVYDLLDR